MSNDKLIGLFVEPNPTKEYADSVMESVGENICIVANMLALDHKDFKNAIDVAYPHGHTWRCLSREKGHYVSSKGVYHYPEDPPLTPLVKITCGDQLAYYYPYDMIVINGKVAARID